MNDRPAAGTRVSITGVRRSFDNGVVALDNITLDVEPGEFVAVLGPSGSGKSTLLRLIAGLDRPQAGSIDATTVGATTPSLPLAPADRGREGQDGRTRLAYVFQDAHLLPWRSVLRNVALPLELAGTSRNECHAAAMEAIEQVGLADAARRYPAQLSGGMRMRVSLARALVTNPSLFLLDEPFAALDEITRHRLDEHLRGLWARRGMTVVFVTHSIGEAVFLAQRAVVLSRRPARVVFDRRVELPDDRTEELRTTANFARESHALHVALRGEEP